MARNCNENDEDSIDPTSVVANMKSTLKPELIKELLKNTFQDNKSKLGNDTLTLVVEVAKCLVSETCLRASSSLRETSDGEKCLPQLVRYNANTNAGFSVIKAEILTALYTPVKT